MERDRGIDRQTERPIAHQQQQQSQGTNPVPAQLQVSMSPRRRWLTKPRINNTKWWSPLTFLELEIANPPASPPERDETEGQENCGLFLKEAKQPCWLTKSSNIHKVIFTLLQATQCQILLQLLLHEVGFYSTVASFNSKLGVFTKFY